MLLLLQAVLFLVFTNVHSYKILVYNSKFSISHTRCMLNIADVLVEAGHDVTTLLVHMDASVRNQSTLSKMIHVDGDPAAVELFDSTSLGSSDVFTAHRKGIIFTLGAAPSQGRGFALQCRKTIHTDGLIERLRNEHFDVVIAETFDFCGIGLAHAIEPKAVITTSTSAIYEIAAIQLGVPLVPNYYPEFPGMNVNSLWDRLHNLDYFIGTTIFIYTYQYYAEQEFRNAFGPEFPAFSDIIADSAFYFTESDALVDVARPTIRKMVEIGGFAAAEPKPLDKEWLDVLSRRPKAVLISFGSIIQSSQIKPEYRRAILKTISNFPDTTFIWKYENLTDAFARNEVSKVPNAYLSPWLPQNDLLDHPRVVGFISHGGMGSTQEATSRGVPGVFIPLFADQYRNAAVLDILGLAVVYEKYDIGNAEKLTQAVSKLLNMKSLHECAQRASRVLRARPNSPREQLVRHVEFAAQFGALPNLKPRGLQQSYLTYFFLDIAFYALVILLLVTYSSYALFKLATSTFFSSNKLKQA